MTEDTITPTVNQSQACVILGIGPGALQALVETGLLEEQRVGELVRFTHEALAECIHKLALRRTEA